MAALAGLSLGAHYDLFKEPERPGDPRVLVATSRICHVCGGKLTGAVVPVDGDRQVHVRCRGRD